MIYVYTGTPGSGKSYMATRAAYEWIVRLHPRPVIANYNLDFGREKYQKYFHYMSNDDLTVDFLEKFAAEYFSTHDFHEEQILLIQDEIQIIANSRTWNERDRLRWITFYSQHRHLGYKIIMIAQSTNMVDRQYRALFEYEVNHRKLANFGIVGKVLSLLALGRVYAQVTTYYGLKERVGVRFFVPRSKIFKLYDSFTLFQGKNQEQTGKLLPDPSS